MRTLTVCTFWGIAEKLLFCQPEGLCNTGMMSWSVWRKGEWRKISNITPFYILKSTQMLHDYVTVCRERKLPITFIRDSSPIRWERRHNKWKETPMYVLPIFFISAETTGNFLWIWLVREKEFVSEIIQTENNDVVKPKWLNSPQFR